MTTAMTRNGHFVRNPYNLMRDFLGFDPFGAMETRTAKTAVFAPTFEVLERDDGYVVRADVPGVRERDLDITMQNNVLTISGARAAEERKEGDTYYLYERQYGSFSRSFTLPDAADGDAIEGKLTDGVLTIRIGKRAESKPRRIALSK